MIDSVLLRHCRLLPPPGLTKFNRQGDRAFFRVESAGYSPTLFCRCAPDGRYYLSAEASLPKLVYGDNVRMLGDGELSDALKMRITEQNEHQLRGKMNTCYV